MYTLEMILHYLRKYKKQYILLGIQMTIALTLVFVVRSTELSLVKLQNDPSVENKTSFIVEVTEPVDTELLSDTIDAFLAENGDRQLDCKKMGNMYMISSYKMIDDLYTAFRSALTKCGEGIMVSRQNTMDNLKNMAVGIEYTADIIRLVMLIISVVVIVGFTGFIMLMLLRREHDMLAAYLCGVNLRRLIFMSTVEISIVGIISGIAGTLLGCLVTPVMGNFGAAGIYRITPKLASVGSIIFLLLIIYSVPVIIFAVRMSSYDPLVQIRMEEN